MMICTYPNFLHTADQKFVHSSQLSPLISMKMFILFNWTWLCRLFLQRKEFKKKKNLLIFSSYDKSFPILLTNFFLPLKLLLLIYSFDFKVSNNALAEPTSNWHTRHLFWYFSFITNSHKRTTLILNIC